MTVRILAGALAPWTVMADYERQARSGQHDHGASAVFVGTMRDFNDGDAVAGMWLEHYPGMTERHLEAIAANARQNHQLLDVLIVHRIGDIAPGDPIVLVAVWSAHRANAFKACREIMEALKSKAPFWKKETLTQTGDQPGRNSRWVSRNTKG